jgi:hypothetical protein
LQRVALARQKPSTSIDESAICRAEVFDKKLTVVIDYPCVAARNFCLWIILIQIDIRKDTAVGVPSPDVGFDAGYLKLFSDSSSPLYYEPRDCP